MLPTRVSRRFRSALALLLAAWAAGIYLPAAAGTAPELVRVRDGWARGTVEGQTGSGAYMELTSREDARLVGASCDAADRVEIHEMRVVKDMMTMRKVDSVPLPANTPVALDHDFHLMLIGLRHQLKAGQELALTLHLLDAAGAPHSVRLVLPVRALNTSAARAPAARE